jgi:hypothetical protein
LVSCNRLYLDFEGIRRPNGIVICLFGSTAPGADDLLKFLEGFIEYKEMSLRSQGIIERLTLPEFSCISQPLFEIRLFRGGKNSDWKNGSTTF